MAFVSKSFLVITIAMLVLVALIMTLLQHWFVLALVVVLAGIFTALARVISERPARTRHERLENEYLNSWPVHSVLLKDDRPGTAWVGY